MRGRTVVNERVHIGWMDDGRAHIKFVSVTVVWHRHMPCTLINISITPFYFLQCCK